MGSTCINSYQEEPRSARYAESACGLIDNRYESGTAYCTQCMDFSNNCHCTFDRPPQQQNQQNLQNQQNQQNQMNQQYQPQQQQIQQQNQQQNQQQQYQQQPQQRPCMGQAFSEEYLPEVTACGPTYGTLQPLECRPTRCQSAAGCRQSMRRVRHRSAHEMGQIGTGTGTCQSTQAIYQPEPQEPMVYCVPQQQHHGERPLVSRNSWRKSAGKKKKPAGSEVGLPTTTLYPPAGNQMPTSYQSPTMVRPLTQPAPEPVLFGVNPVRIYCQRCQCHVMTSTTYTNGVFTWLMCCLGLVCCPLASCLYPFCLKSCKNVVHSCPFCRVEFADYKRL